MNKLITKLIVAINNSEAAKTVLAFAFVLGIIMLSHKVDIILNRWLI